MIRCLKMTFFHPTVRWRVSCIGRAIKRFHFHDGSYVLCFMSFVLCLSRKLTWPLWSEGDLCSDKKDIPVQGDENYDDDDTENDDADYNHDDDYVNSHDDNEVNNCDDNNIDDDNNDDNTRSSDN